MPTDLIPHYDGLYGDLSARPSSEYFFLEPISARSKTFDWVIQPHTHTQLYQVFVVEKGELLFQEVHKNHQLTAPCICLIPPTHLHGITYTPPIEGYIMTVSEMIVEDIFKTSPSVFQTFEKIQVIQSFDDEYSFHKLQTLIASIEQELFNDYAQRTTMLRAYLMQFFIWLHRMSKEDIQSQSHSMAMGYFRKFQKKIKEGEFAKSIPEYAHDLHITPVHLNRVCKAIAGKSAIELVHQNVVSEAKKYLLHTSYSVSEIAYLLKFDYPNYFAKLFKKYTGVSPIDFRKMGRN